MNILKFSEASRVCFLPPMSKEVTLKKLTDLSESYLYDKEKFLDALLEREKLMSTGMGFEIAYPHSKNRFVVDFFLTIGISSAGINWNSFDGKNVKLIFLIGGLVEEQEKYLELLATLSNMVKRPENRDRMIHSGSESEFYEIFTELALKENQAV